MKALLLRLAAPLQSWGEHSTFAERDTLSYPSRSGLVGLLASAQGVPRGASLAAYAGLRFTVRIDRPGVRTVDFHTIGGGFPASATVPTAEGKRRGAGAGTIVTRRHYLADAVFTVAIEGDDALIDDLAGAVEHPRWQPFLGRRSCPPDPPFLLRAGAFDAVTELREHVPIARRRPSDITGTVLVDFVCELDGSARPPGLKGRAELADDPQRFSTHERRYGVRAVAIVTEQLPAHLCQSRGRSYQDALFDYVRGAVVA